MDEYDRQVMEDLRRDIGKLVKKNAELLDSVAGLTGKLGRATEAAVTLTTERDEAVKTANESWRAALTAAVPSLTVCSASGPGALCREAVRYTCIQRDKRIAVLEETLRGRHTNDCAVYEEKPCDCGIDAALAGGKDGVK